MYGCKKCGNEIPQTLCDEYAQFCGIECQKKYALDQLEREACEKEALQKEARNQQDKYVGNILTWLIVAFLMGAIILWAIPAKAYHSWMRDIEAIVCEELADAITIVDIEVDGTVEEYNAVVGSINERVACLRMLISVKKKANPNDLLYSRKWEGKTLGVLLVISGNGERGYAIVHTAKPSRSESI